MRDEEVEILLAEHRKGFSLLLENREKWSTTDSLLCRMQSGGKAGPAARHHLHLPSIAPISTNATVRYPPFTST